mmetsp:Transcript_27913/g.80653  ORF Transcript_27913/g.80653 Transcript_27913/m.80653 type:complete len:209 (-) Transcript_27913:359-985(-)
MRQGRIFELFSKLWKTQPLPKWTKALPARGLLLQRVRLVLLVPPPMLPPALLRRSLVQQHHDRQWQCNHTRRTMRHHLDGPIIRPLPTKVHRGSIYSSLTLHIRLPPIPFNTAVRRSQCPIQPMGPSSPQIRREMFQEMPQQSRGRVIAHNPAGPVAGRVLLVLLNQRLPATETSQRVMRYFISLPSHSNLSVPERNWASLATMRRGK